MLWGAPQPCPGTARPLKSPKKGCIGPHLCCFQESREWNGLPENGTFRVWETLWDVPV